MIFFDIISSGSKGNATLVFANDHLFLIDLGIRSRPDYEDFCKETLELLIAEAAESFEILPLEQDLDLLRNVIYSGVWQRYILKTEQKQKHRKEGVHGQ